MRPIPKWLRWFSALCSLAAIWKLGYAAHHAYLAAQFTPTRPVGVLVDELRTQSVHDLIWAVVWLTASVIPVLWWVLVTSPRSAAPHEAAPSAVTV